MSPRGFRGYIGSRPVRGTSYPQRIQNLVVRDYAARRGLSYLLSATEHCMPGSYMILDDVIAELPVLEGVIFFSIFQLPKRAERRNAIYRTFLERRAQLHVALEDLKLETAEDIARFEDMIRVSDALARTPMRGYDSKRADDGEPFRETILAALAGDAHSTGPKAVSPT